jgi:two-component system, cell cycle sensor histidine kinase and response regulator CckA
MQQKTDTGTRGTVLIVDDDPSILILIQTVLSRAGYRVLVAPAPEDAIRRAMQKHLHIDLALLDVRMPGIQGPQLAGQLLAFRPNLRVLFMSGFIDDEIIRIKMLNQKSFLSKPFGSDGLLRAVSQALEAPPLVRRYGPQQAHAAAS